MHEINVLPIELLGLFFKFFTIKTIILYHFMIKKVIAYITIKRIKSIKTIKLINTIKSIKNKKSIK